MFYVQGDEWYKKRLFFLKTVTFTACPTKKNKRNNLWVITRCLQKGVCKKRERYHCFKNETYLKNNKNIHLICELCQKCFINAKHCNDVHIHKYQSIFNDCINRTFAKKWDLKQFIDGMTNTKHIKKIEFLTKKIYCCDCANCNQSFSDPLSLSMFNLLEKIWKVSFINIPFIFAI